MSDRRSGQMRFSLSADVILVPVEDGSARLLDLDGAFYALSRSGAELLGRVLDSDIETAVLETSSAYAVSPSRVEKDLRALLRELESAGLVQRGAPRRKSEWRARAAAIAARAFVRAAPDRSVRVLVVAARLSFALFGFAHTVRAWGQAAARRHSSPSPDGARLIDEVDRAVRDAAARIPSCDCKERALCGWYLLLRKGLPATLVVGIQLYPLAGHCWCEIDGRVITDFEDRCRSYMPVARCRDEAFLPA